MRLTVTMLLACLAASPRADTLDVPAEYATIQAALDAAVAGDEVAVAPGTYAEAVVLPAFALTLRATGDARVTVIDAAGLSAPALEVPWVNEAAVLIEGFTLTGGKGKPGLYGNREGGGVFVGLASTAVTLRACRITGNSARSGGGLYGPARLEDCLIAGNVADDGGGVYWSSFPQTTLVGCTVQDNVAVSGSGGGLWGSFDLQDTLVSGNSAAIFGGGLYGSGKDLAWDGVVFSGNGAQQGGGAYLFATTPIEVVGTRFVGNAASGAGGSLVLASCAATPNVLRDCTFLGNTVAGGPLALLPSLCIPPRAQLLGCTFVGEVVDGALEVESCILRGAPAPILSAQAVEWSDVEGGWPGPGNIDADPLFADLSADDTHLLPGSPCRNGGDPMGGMADGTLDPDGDPRILEGRIDMGADEFADDCNANGLLDWQDVQAGTSADCEGDYIPDECEPFLDCNGNGVRDQCDIAAGTSGDCNANGVPDECEPFDDCDGNGVFDPCESGDCNANGVLDVCDIAQGTSPDVDGNGLPDECHAILYVPSQYATLQAAVAAAAGGDSILVEPGVLSGPGNVEVVLDKPMLVAGAEGAAACVIDAQQAGRVFDVRKASVTVRGLTLRGGVAGLTGISDGGCMTVHDDAQLVVEDCALIGNAAPGQQLGGAVAVCCGAKVDLRRCVVAGNVAGFGGGIHVYGGGGGASASVVECTFAGNAATGSFGISKGDSLRVVQGGQLVVRDTIVRDDPQTSATPVHANHAGTLVEFAYCDVEGGEAGVKLGDGALLTWGPGNLDADPLFKDAAAGDYRLSGGSPCIDAGDPAGAPDADGTPPDMGAIAFSPFEDLGFALAGAGGAPLLQGAGTTIAGDPLDLALSNAAPSAPATLVLGTSLLFAPFKGGVMVPDANLLIGPLPVAADGTLVLSAPWPGGVPSGTLLWIQAWVPDAGGPAGFAASNGLAVEAR
jgi:nitrous oxidase accessory protein NosD